MGNYEIAKIGQIEKMVKDLMRWRVYIDDNREKMSEKMVEAEKQIKELLDRVDALLGYRLESRKRLEELERKHQKHYHHVPPGTACTSGVYGPLKEQEVPDPPAERSGLHRQDCQCEECCADIKEEPESPPERPEPKFKVGDWVRFLTTEDPWQIADIKDSLAMDEQRGRWRPISMLQPATQPECLCDARKREEVPASGMIILCGKCKQPILMTIVEEK